MVRIPEHNDWVVFILFGCCTALVLMLLYLQRESSLKEFLTQKYEDSGNIFASWMVVSVVNALLLSTLLSQYVPSPPKPVDQISVLGFSINKFGYALGAISLFYALKTILSYLFYASIAQAKRWERFWFAATKFYFVLSMVLVVANFVNYFYSIDKLLYFKAIIALLPIFFIFKVVFFTLNKNHVLPKEWFYKILYICTLQVAPILGVWRLLFF